MAANDSPDVNDKLVSITSDVGTVTLTGDTAVPAPAACCVVGDARRPADAAGERRGAPTPREADGDADQADHQRPDLRLHVHLRAGRRDHRSRCRSRPARHPAATPPAVRRLARRLGRTLSRVELDRSATRPSTAEVLSVPAATVTAWPRQFESTFAVPLFGVPPRHGQMGGPLPGLRHLGHRRRSRRAGRGRTAPSGVRWHRPRPRCRSAPSIPATPATSTPASANSTGCSAAAWCPAR